MSVSRCRFDKRAVLACATCSHNDPLYTDKVSKFARRRICKGFGGRELERFDSVNPVAILGDVVWPAGGCRILSLVHPLPGCGILLRDCPRVATQEGGASQPLG